MVAMFSRFRLILLLSLPLAGVMVGCGEKREPPKERHERPDILARVGDEVITVAAFQTEAARRKVSGTNEAGKRALLDEMVQDLRLLDHARKKGYERDPDILRRYHALLIARAREDFVPENAASAKGVSDEEVAAYYEIHKADYAVASRVRVAMIFVATPPGLNPEALAAKKHKIEEARAAVIAANLAPATAFGRLAATYSENQDTRYIGGELGYQVKGMTGFSSDPLVLETVFGLRAVGNLSEVVAAKEGLYFFKLLEIDPGGSLPLAKVQGRIRSQLYAARQKSAHEAMSNALAAIPAEVHAENLNDPALSSSLDGGPVSTSPPGVPGEPTAVAPNGESNNP